MKVTRILHASVNVHGHLEETARWYGGLLGLDPADRPEIPGIPGTWFRADDAQVHLVGAPPEGSEIDPTGPHFCFGVEDIEAAVAELEERRIPYRRGSQGPVAQVWVADPAGNTIELQQDRPL